MDKPVKLRKGMELMKRRGKTGPVRTVVRLHSQMAGLQRFATLEWTQVTARKGQETLQETKILMPSTGLPAGYVLAKDRQAKKAGGK